MSVKDKTADALALDEIQLPSSPEISQIEWEDYQDSTGEPSLRVRVILAENTDVSKVSGEQIGEVKAAIRDSLVAHGVSKFPYIFITTPEELAEPDDEEQRCTRI